MSYVPAFVQCPCRRHLKYLSNEEEAGSRREDAASSTNLSCVCKEPSRGSGPALTRNIMGSSFRAQMPAEDEDEEDQGAGELLTFKLGNRRAHTFQCWLGLRFYSSRDHAMP